MKIHLDFETRSTVDIFRSGAWVYSSHPSTEILCMCYCIDSGPVHTINRDDILCNPNVPVTDTHKELFEAIAAGALVYAHNAFFEQSIWTNICVPQLKWPKIPPTQWRCTMAKANAHALPASLVAVAKALNTNCQKNMAGKKVMMKLCQPNTDGEWNEDPEDLEQLYNYCVDDVRTERDVDDRLHDLIPAEQTVWFLDQLINRRGIAIDRDALQIALGFITELAGKMKDEVFELTGGHLDGVSRRLRVMNWVKDNGVDISGYTKSDVNAVLERDDIPDDVRRVLEIKLSLGKASLKKYDAMVQSLCDDGRIRDLLVYHGASTGRWAGKLVQLQNLPKGTIKDTDTAIEILKFGDLEFFQMMYPDAMGALSACIRGMIVASPGHELFVADYAAIEARVVMWLAGEDGGLRKFANGEDLYVDMARTIYNKRDISKGERQLGKTAILGCGYGMGAVKFHATCTNWGIPVTEELAAKAVTAYRETYGAVRSYWYSVESAAIQAVVSNKPADCGKVRWFLQGDFLFCRLPSGRCLAYYRPRVEKVDTKWGLKDQLLFYAENPKTHQWEEESTYGGKLTENITQAVSRDILAEAMLRCERGAYKIAFSVHDEIVAEVPEGQGAVEEFTRLLCVPPTWAKDCPIAVEGWKGKRYRKG